MKNQGKGRNKIFQALCRGNFNLLFGLVVIIFFIIVATFGPLLIPLKDDLDLTRRLAAPSFDHIFGCDLYGRDVFEAAIWGARSSMYVAIITVIISTILGTSIGVLSGYFKGFWDQFFMRTADVLMAFPGILLTMTLASLLGPSLNNIIISISATGWTKIGRAHV